MQNFWSFFAFPLNLLIAVLWIWGWVFMWKKHPEKFLIKFFLSPSATLSAILLLLISCIWIGISADQSFIDSWLFVAALLYVQTVLLLVTLRGWKTSGGTVRWRFLLLHAGLLLTIGSGYWGAPDSSEMRVALELGQETEVAYNMDGSLTGLGYRLSLRDCSTELSENGQPVHYEALISIDGATPVCLMVNSPHEVGLGEDIYLASVSPDYCVLQIVIEPWKYFALPGILMMLAGAFLLFIKGPRR